MKENKAFRILFITKKQLKSRQASHRMFLKPQYKVYRGASILYFNTSFSDVLSFFKNISTPRLEPTNGKQCCLPPLFFIIQEISLLVRIKFKQFHTFMHIANCSLYLHYMYIYHCNNFEHFCV